jgi:ankyrin repeat protein
VILDPEEPLARATVEAIRNGDTDGLRRLLAEHPGLATARIGDDRLGGTTRSLLHVATDWPGHFPGGPATVAVLVAAGAEVDARFGGGSHDETPLHWAASSDDVEVLDALLDAGADIEAPGGVIGGGTPLADARAFGQWRAAHRLVERGARTTIDDAATLGMLDRLETVFAGAAPAADEVTRAFWGACHGGQRACAEFLLDRGADIDWIPPWEPLTPLDAAARGGADDLVAWLRSRGARPAAELPT